MFVLYRTHGSCSLVLDNFLHIALFTLFAFFARLLGTALSPAVSPARLHPLSFFLWKESHRQLT